METNKTKIKYLLGASTVCFNSYTIHHPPDHKKNSETKKRYEFFCLILAKFFNVCWCQLYFLLPGHFMRLFRMTAVVTNSSCFSIFCHVFDKCIKFAHLKTKHFTLHGIWHFLSAFLQCYFNMHRYLNGKRQDRQIHYIQQINKSSKQ